MPSEKGWMYHQAKTVRNLWGAPSVEYNDEMWETVSLPHDYIIEQTPTSDGNQGLGYLKPENAWYRKKFTLDDEDKDKRICLYFEGIATNSEVWLNGSLIKRSFAGYYGFEADISDFLSFDRENVLAVYVNTTDNHEGWWYEGGGIYRHVWLEKYEQISVDRFGIYIEPKKIDIDNWSADCEVTVRSDLYKDCNITVRTEIIDKDVTVCSAEAETTIPCRDSHVVTANMKVKKPHLWDIDDPYQYTIRTHIFVNGTETDCQEVMFGFRSFECNGDGMILNGKPIFLNGVCAHQDFGLCGKAVPDNIHRYKVGLIKEMGANAYRCSHYPHSEVTMDELDRLGFVVMDEVRRFESTEEGLEQLRMLIKRDRNRPSVFFWSVGNEEPISLTENGRRIFAVMKAEIRKLDKTRPVMCALSERPEETTFLDNCDVIGINYNLNKYDAIHEQNPQKMIFASECCASGTTRGWYFDDCPEKGYINAIDKDPDSWFAGRERTWKFFSSRKWIAGGFQWIAFEHRGECLWPRLCSQSGAIDMFMQKKDAFYQNQS
ncbi:MAG: glycoside hydrolase family 2 TIM barrel-domain containing protein, partial [Clostridiales bacterium]|nr:glycoside hydrolase family 2 TIM barrel-domain containing protein [Clostridiales bacterium]